MPFCPNCGMRVSPSARYCESCGQELPKAQPIPSPPKKEPPPPPKSTPPPKSELPIIRRRIPDTSRLSGVGIDKFLGPGERIIYRTRSQVWFGNRQRRAYVTNRRVMFYHREPRLIGLITEDKLDELEINGIRKMSLVEQGLITKSMILHLDEYRIKGDRGDIINFYKAIQSVRGQI